MKKRCKNLDPICDKCGDEKVRRARGEMVCRRCVAEWSRRYKMLNAEKQAEWDGKRKYDHAKRRASRKAWMMEGDLTKLQMGEVIKRDGSCCVYCGVPVVCNKDPINSRGFDHVVPRSRGGVNTMSNIVVCCSKCNRIKANDTPEKLMERLAERAKWAEQK